LFASIPLPLSFRLYAFIVIRRSAEQQPRSRFCPMTSTNRKSEHVLADLYDVAVKQIKRQVRRNKDRFPADFMF
jgi:hypothetical protein